MSWPASIQVLPGGSKATVAAVSTWKGRIRLRGHVCILNIDAHMYVHIVYIYTYLDICIYVVYISVCVYTHIYIYIYIYIHTDTCVHIAYGTLGLCVFVSMGLGTAMNHVHMDLDTFDTRSRYSAKCADEYC